MPKQILSLIILPVMLLTMLLSPASAEETVFSATADVWQAAVVKTAGEILGKEVTLTENGSTVTASAEGMTDLIARIGEGGSVTAVDIAQTVYTDTMAEDTAPLGMAAVLCVVSMGEAESTDPDVQGAVEELSALPDLIKTVSVDERGKLDFSMACSNHRLHISVQLDEDNGKTRMQWQLSYCP